MRDIACRLVGCMVLCSLALAAQGQSNPRAVEASSLGGAGGDVSMDQRLQLISNALDATRQQLEQSQQQIQRLQEELAIVRRQLSAATGNPASSADTVESQPPREIDLKERVEALEAQVKVHDQMKLESSSKYAIRVNGLILFNGFINRGAVDNLDLPSVAVRSTTGSTGTAGATMRQTILGIEGFGPRVAGARTSADVSFDFYGGVPYSNYGSTAGLVRMRTSGIHLNWERDVLEGGMEAPLISPLSPTSYATVAEPGMAWAGNLWTWAPQLRYAHQFLDAKERRWQFEFGLWDPPQAGYNSTDVFRAPSPGERSSQPAYETRVSFGSGDTEHGLQAGVSGYYSRQRYSVTSTAASRPYSENNDSWSFAADLRLPIAHRVELSGEGYRGRSLGGLGGGVYKDVLVGTDPVTGTTEIRGLNAIGGWTQLKARFGGLLEGNASIGLDNGYASDFHAVVLPPAAGASQSRARNRMVVGNLIYRPKTYLILSPEYRRIWTWPISGARSTADIFTMSVGYQF